MSKILYTYTDEAPALATHSLYPIIEHFCRPAGVELELKDISLAGRILAHFPDNLKPDQKIADALAELGDLAKRPEANIIKLPNISASIPQLVAAIRELQEQGYAVPDFPDEPKNQEELEIRTRYGRVLGSAVNPVLREGNSDRRVAPPVKEYAQSNPHSMGAWDKNSKSHVSWMEDGDFYGSEQSHKMSKAESVRIEFSDASGQSTVLKANIPLQQDEIIDATVMNRAKLRNFVAQEIEDAKSKDLLFSIHLKATMMKVSDPIIFGHALAVFFQGVFEKHAGTFADLGVDQRNGLGDLMARLENLPKDKRDEIVADFKQAMADGPDLAMVDSDNGITNFHFPNDIIIDASMPAAIRSSGQMWGPDGKQKDTKYVIPDRCYSRMYQEVIADCKKHGAFDVATMGNVANVGLMAQKAEEYGSHDKTFEMPTDGTVKVISDSGEEIFNHRVEQGDIWRMCQTKDAPIKDWVKLAVNRARATGAATVFWLDSARAHDAQLIAKVEQYLKDHDTSGLDIRVLAPVAAVQFTLERVRAGKDTISVTGNVLRDYLTDLFPILELGTSAKMLSIVPLLAGGGLYETGAGGSAPKHVQQFEREGHLRWDSLGEFLALAVSLAELGEKTKNDRAVVLADALNVATSKFLQNNKSPSRKVGELDNRGSHFYIALYWAQALAEQDRSAELQAEFAPLAQALAEGEDKIIGELNAAQGPAVDVGGYYHPNWDQTRTAMRPSATLNSLIP